MGEYRFPFEPLVGHLQEATKKYMSENKVVFKATKENTDDMKNEENNFS